MQRADRRAARAGERSLPDATACLCGMLLAKVLRLEELCDCMPGKARVRGMRHLYAVLQWTSQRVAAAVRGCLERRCAVLEQRWVHLCWPAPHLWPAAAHAVFAFCMMRPCPPPASPAWLGRPRTQYCSLSAVARRAPPQLLSLLGAQGAHEAGARFDASLGSYVPDLLHLMFEELARCQVPWTRVVQPRPVLPLRCMRPAGTPTAGRAAGPTPRMRTAPVAQQEERPVSEQLGERSALLWAASSCVPQ